GIAGRGGRRSATTRTGCRRRDRPRAGRRSGRGAGGVRGPQFLVRGLAIHGLVIVTTEHRALNDGAAFGRREWPDAGLRWQEPGPLNDGRRALRVQKRHERLPDRKFGDRPLGIDRRVLPHRLRGGPDRFLIARRERTQRMLHAIAELAEHRLWNVEWILRDEVDADALGSNQAYDLLDLLHERIRRVVEQQVRLIEE